MDEVAYDGAARHLVTGRHETGGNHAQTRGFSRISKVSMMSPILMSP
jgi:hypothetical protein